MCLYTTLHAGQTDLTAEAAPASGPHRSMAEKSYPTRGQGGPRRITPHPRSGQDDKSNPMPEVRVAAEGSNPHLRSSGCTGEEG